MTSDTDKHITEANFTRLPNDYLEAKARVKMPPEAARVLSAIERMVWGYGKEAKTIDLPDLSLMTELAKPNAIRGRTWLVKSRMLIFNSDNETYRIVRDFSKWKALSRMITLSKMETNVLKNDNDRYQKWKHIRNKEKKEKTKRFPGSNPNQSIPEAWSRTDPDAVKREAGLL